MLPSRLAYYSLSPVFILLVLSSMYLNYTNVDILMDWHLSSLTTTPIHISLIFDKQGLTLSTVVIFISMNIMGFSSTYMQGDPHLKRFISLVLLFVLSMNLLIMIPNVFTMLIGWDGLGIVSFLLVIYYSNPKSLSAGMITALTNRIGDALILLSIAWLTSNNNWSIINLWASEDSVLIMTSIMFAACTKSAQVPFSSWLPAAMAAPTPVSALVHSSTLVTAGVFLLVRFYPFLSNIPLFNYTLTALACMTTVMAGVSAIVEPDLKKIIALSTLSQLGMMMGSIGIGLPEVALFHLSTHAMFKALLFVCAGNMIHFNLHSQDLRTAGNFKCMPLTTSCFLIANLALCGTPFLAAFYSKDLILETSLFYSMNAATLIMFFTATTFTALYTTRFLLTAMWSPSSFQPLNSLNEDNIITPMPMLMLSAGAIFGGSLLNWVTVSPMLTPTLPTTLKYLTIMVVTLGLLLASIVSYSSHSPTKTLPLALSFNSSMWFLTPLSSQFILKRPLLMGFKLTHTIDQGWQEIMGGQGSNTLTKSPLSVVLPLQNNMVSTQLMLALMFILILFISMV